MNNKALIFIVAAVLIVIFAVSTVFFRKKGARPTYNQPVNPPVSQPVKPIIKPLSEEEKLKIIAESFVEMYETYILGDFSNVQILKDKMTDRLLEEKLKWIEDAKEKLKDQPKRYITFTARPKKSDLALFNNNEAEVIVGYTQEETKGAMIQGEITIEYVNEFGEKKPVPPTTETSKKMYLKLIKVNDEWMVDKVENIN